MEILTNDELQNFVIWKTKETPRERFLISKLDDYIFSANDGKIAVLYGLRRTGKTIMMMQEFQHIHDFSKCMLIHCEENDSMYDVKKALREHPNHQYIFLDEITKVEDFIQKGSILADIYASGGKKIVIAGTDSLGLMFTAENELYNRSRIIHTSYIPFREYHFLLGKTIEDYIMYGGTLTDGKEQVFYNKDSEEEYRNTAIVSNIIKSLSKSKFRESEILFEKFSEQELASFINQTIEENSHRFLAEIINREFKSHTVGSLVQLMLSKTDKDMRFLKAPEMQEIIRDALEVIPYKTLVEQEYISILVKLLKKIDMIWESDSQTPEHYIFTQCGMRYCQVDEIAYALLQSKLFRECTDEEKKITLETLDRDVKGGIFEDIIFYQISRVFLDDEKYNPKKYPDFRRKDKINANVCKYRSGGHEIDVLVEEKFNDSLVAIEIKWNENQYEGQTKHLLDEQFCDEIEETKGKKILNSVVIYRGKSCNFANGNVLYLNAEEFLFHPSEYIKLLSKKHYQDILDLQNDIQKFHS